jgi:hypothetical protein
MVSLVSATPVIAAAYACRQDIWPNDPAFASVHVASIEQAPNGDELFIRSSNVHRATRGGDRRPRR